MKKLIECLLFAALMISASWLNARDIDTLEIRVSENERIILLAKDMNKFNTIKVDSVLDVVRTKYGTFQKASVRTKDSLLLGGNLDNKVKADYKLNPNSKSLNLRIGSGVALVRNIFAPQFNFGLELEKSPLNTDVFRGVYLEASSYFFFTKQEENYSTDLNLFLNAGIGLFRFRQDRRFNMGLGALIVRNNNYFDKNTFRFFSEFSPSATIPLSLIPELYITGAFKKVMPGLSLRVHF